MSYVLPGTSPNVGHVETDHAQRTEPLRVGARVHNAGSGAMLRLDDGRAVAIEWDMTHVGADNHLVAGMTVGDVIRSEANFQLDVSDMPEWAALADTPLAEVTPVWDAQEVEDPRSEALEAVAVGFEGGRQVLFALGTLVESEIKWAPDNVIVVFD